jgi:hypothetical protein
MSGAVVSAFVLGTFWLQELHWLFALVLACKSFRVGNITVDHVEHIASVVVSAVVVLLPCASLLGWVLERRQSSVHLVGAVQDVIHISELDPSAPTWRNGPLLVLLESHIIIINSLGKVASFVLTGSPRIGSIDVVWIDIQHCCKVLNALINLAEFLEWASSDVVCSCIVWIKLHQLVAVLNGFSKPPLLEERRGSDEESFFVSWVFLQFLRAHRNQIVNVQSL